MDTAPPYEVRRLLEAAGVNWTNIDGEHASRGVNPGDLDPARFCNLIHWWLHTNMAPDQWDQFTALLASPDDEPVTTTPVPIMTEEEEGAAFMAFMGAATGEGVSTVG